MDPLLNDSGPGNHPKPYFKFSVVSRIRILTTADSSHQYVAYLYPHCVSALIVWWLNASYPRNQIWEGIVGRVQ